MGKRSAVLLTKRTVDAARPDQDRYHIWDSELSGFGLCVVPSGMKTFIIKYRTDGGGRSTNQRVLTTGRFGPVTVEQARKLAKVKLGRAMSRCSRNPRRDACGRVYAVARVMTFHCAMARMR
ncbi:Arm DNA-binding domain-containing protein [Rhizobium sp. LEGMi12c]